MFWVIKQQTCIIPCDTCNTYQELCEKMYRFGENRPKFKALFNDIPDLACWSLCTTAHSQDSINITVHSQSHRKNTSALF